MHRANASVLIVLGLLACARNARHAALGSSLGGEAHVFLSGDRFARDLYKQLTGSGRLTDSLARRPLVAVAPQKIRSATVLSASGAAPARLTLARFHAGETCGTSDIVTELVLAFLPPAPARAGGGGGPPPSFVTVVALLDAPAANGAPNSGSRARSLPWPEARELVYQVAQRAEMETRGERLGLLHRPVLDTDQASDAGEVVVVGQRYAVGFRATFAPAALADTLLITGVALTDPALRDLRWIVRPRRLPLTRETIPPASRRYSVRGTVAGAGVQALILIDEFADVSARDSRATAVDAATGRLVAARPLALRCP